MINQKPSSPWKRWKFLLVLPLIAAFLFSFNTKEVLKYSYTNTGVEPWEVAFISPLAVNQINKITSGFGPAVHPFTGEHKQHKGIDLSAKRGIPVYASADGTVAISEYQSQNGEYLRLNHQEGFASRYLHLQKRLVETGETVKTGDLIGFVGNSGVSSGPHLHFEILLNDEPQDPLQYIDFGKAEQRFNARAKSSKPKTAQGGMGTVRQPRKAMEGVKSIDIIINSTTSDAELAKIKADLAKDGIDFSYTVVRNADKEITAIELDLNGKGENGAQFNGNYNINGDEPISPIAIHYDDETNQISFGNMEFKGKSMAVGKAFFISGDESEDDQEYRIGNGGGLYIGGKNGIGREEVVILRSGKDSLNWKMLGDTIEIKTIDIKGGEEDMILLNGKTKIIQIESDGSDHKQIIHLNPEEEGEVEIIELHEDGKSKKRKRKKPRKSH